jgi:DNA polymerase epsilon subunit 1
MQKSFKILINEIVKLGGEVVFAHLDKLIINTKKRNHDDATNYTEFLIRTLLGYPMFTYLNLSSGKYWKILLFKDLENYAGIPCKIERLAITSSW